MINTWGIDSHLRHPNVQERIILDRHFASASGRNDDGTVQRLYGAEIDGIEGDVVTYPIISEE